MLHNGLAAAIVLATAVQARHDSAVAEAQKRLFIAIEAASDGITDQFWRPHQRGLMVLKKIVENQIKISPEPSLEEPVAVDFPFTQLSDSNFSFESCRMPTESSHEFLLEEVSEEGGRSFRARELAIEDILDSLLWSAEQ
jgi:hypothetical protein